MFCPTRRRSSPAERNVPQSLLHASAVNGSLQCYPLKRLLLLMGYRRSRPLHDWALPVAAETHQMFDHKKSPSVVHFAAQTISVKEKVWNLEKSKMDSSLGFARLWKSVIPVYPPMFMAGSDHLWDFNQVRRVTQRASP